MGAPTDDWESGFRALTKFVELKGHAGPAGRVHAFGIDLGGWVARRRIAYWDGTLSAAEADLLEKPTRLDLGETATQKLASSTVRIIGRARRAPRHGPVVDSRDRWYRSGRMGEQPSAQPTQNGELTDTQILMLEALPAWMWDNDTVRWENRALCTRDVPPRARWCRCPSLSARQQLRRGQMGVPLPRRASRRHPAPGSYRRTEQAPRVAMGPRERRVDTGDLGP